jgi:hypothetical protein
VASNGLIEKVRTNVALYSEQFDDAYWVKTNTTVVANSGIAPDGTTTAELVYPTTTGSNRLLEKSFSISASTPYTGTWYLKASGLSWVAVDHIDGNVGAWFNLSTGTIGTITSGCTASIVSFGNGWYRCRVSRTSAGGTGYHDIRLVDGDNVTSVTANGTDGVLVWGAQLETGDIATDYIATTTAAVSVGPVSGLPRLDYLNSTCPRLLLEPQRTNVALNSESVATDTNVGYTVTANNTASPDGYVNADRILEDTGTLHLLQKQFTVGSTTDSYAVSFFVKANGRTSGQILYGLSGAPFSSVTSVFDLSAGTITAASGSAGATAGSSKIENYGNGWYRVSVSGVIGTAGTHYVRIQDTNGGVAGDPTKGFQVWGFQAELGAYATSYIPTLGTSVTRVADAAAKTGISSLLNSTQGTIFLQVERMGPSGDSFENLLFISDTSTSNFVNIAFNPSTLRYRGQVREGGVTTGLVDATAAYTGTIKIAIAYAANDLVLYINGVQQAVDTSVTVPTAAFDSLGLGGVFDGTYFDTFRGNYSQALLFKTRLSNSDLATLTTL